MPKPWKPSRDQVQAARGKTVPDLIKTDLKVLFAGINPSLYSAAVGHHFARPGNRFWPTLHGAGFTPRLFSPFEDRSLLDLGYGLTNFVDRASARAEDLTIRESVEGGNHLAEKIVAHGPHIVAFLGITAYRTAFVRPRATVGIQPDAIFGTKLWVLPNPSGLNAHYQLADLARLYRSLRIDAEFRPT